MRKVIDYDETREAIITEQEALGFRLVEDQIHFDGKHLIFENDEPEPEPTDLALEIDNLKARVEKLEKK